MLRPYQISALDEIRKLYAQGIKKVLLHLATGAGKTVVFCDVLKSLYEKKKRAIMVVRGRKLVKQASARLARENVPHGVMMAGSDKAHHHRILVCSIDTMRARGYRPEADLVVIDEAHMATSESYMNFVKDYPNAFFLPVTATPYCEKPLRHVADAIVAPIGIKELTEQGFLVSGRYFCPVTLKLQNVRIDSKTKDYNQRDLAQEMDKLKLVGDIVENWKKYGHDRPTVAFAVTVEHSKHIVEEFNKAGIPAVHADADSPDEFRDHCISRLERGEIKIISNVGIFGIGVDIPFLSCLILARPTQSLILYIQQVGRGLRPAPGKENCIILDHAENVVRHGFPTENHEATIDGKYSEKKRFKLHTCTECFAVIEKFPCQWCGFVKTKSAATDREVIHVEGDLEEMRPGIKTFEAPKAELIKKEIEALDRLVSLKGLKQGFVWHKIKEKFGPDVAKFYLSDRFRKT